MSRIKDLVGQKFGRLTVIELSHQDKNKTAYWECKCDCGNEETKTVRGSQLTGGGTKSCGCLRKERIVNVNKTIKQSSIRSISMSSIDYPHKDKLRNVFYNIKCRCNNPNDKRYKWYGAKGVKVYKDWLDIKLGFFKFYTWAMQNGYKEGLSIDRINSDGNYEPINCRWATMKEQQNNKDTNILVTIGNKTQAIAEWAIEYNLKYDSIMSRYRKGITGMELVEPKLNKSFRNKMIEINGILHKSEEWCVITGIKIKTFENRYSKGDRGLDLIRNTYAETIAIEVNGELLTLSQISYKYNIPIGTIYRRYGEGDRNLDLIKELYSKTRTITEVNGEMLTFNQIAYRYNINVSTIKSRHSRGLRGENLIQPLLRKIPIYT